MDASVSNSWIFSQNMDVGKTEYTDKLPVQVTLLNGSS
jgi:hypothetical protein